MIDTMLGPRLRYLATLLVVGCALAGCGGYVLLWDWALTGLRDRATARLGAYEHVGFFADALRVVYTLLFCAAVLGVAGVVLVKLAARRRDRSPEPSRQAPEHSIFAPLVLWPLYAVLTLPWLGVELTGLCNVLWDGSTPTAQIWFFEKSIPRKKGRSSELLRRGAEHLEVSYVPVRREPGAPVTLLRRRGALGMAYVAER